MSHMVECLAEIRGVIGVFSLWQQTTFSMSYTSHV
jgi:hypothetical protein